MTDERPIFPEGTYRGLYHSIEATEVGAKNTPTIEAKFFPEDVVALNDPSQQAAALEAIQYYRAKGWSITVFCYFSEGAKKYSVEKLAAIGFNQDFENPEVSVNSIELRCVQDEYDGTVRNKWDFANWGGGAIGAPASNDALYKIKDAFKQAGIKPPKRAAVKPAPAPAMAKPAPAKPEDPQAAYESAFGVFVEHRCQDCPEDGDLINDRWINFFNDNCAGKDMEDFSAQEWKQLAVLAKSGTPF